jgi:hypothetical protein
MAPVWLPECECAVEDAVEDALAEDVTVLADAEDVLAAESVYTPEAPKIAPGPYSGLSISNTSEKPLQSVTRSGKETKGNDAHHQRHTTNRGPTPPMGC